MIKINKKNFRAFTLIELLVVISVVGLLSTLIAVQVKNAQIKGRDARRLSDLNAIKKAMALKYDSGSTTYSCTDLRYTYFVYPLNTCAGLSEYVKIEQLVDPKNTTEPCDGTNTGPCNYALNSLPVTARIYFVYFHIEGKTNFGNEGETNCVMNQLSQVACKSNINFSGGCNGQCAGGADWDACKIFDLDGSGCIGASDRNYAWNNR